MKRKSILTDPLFYSLAVVLWILSSVSSSASAQLIKLNVGYSAISEEQLPAWIAKETGIFEKNGLDVQLIYFTGGTTTVQALVSGEVPISQVAGPAVVNSALAGSDVVMVAGGATSADYWLMSRPEIKKAEQLKGKSLGISRFGTSIDTGARVALRHFGLVPEKDVAIGSPVAGRNRSWPPSADSSLQIWSVRVSCQTSALWIGFPLDRSHTMVVSRWFVTPTAARSLPEIPAFFSAPMAGWMKVCEPMSLPNASAIRL